MIFPDIPIWQSGIGSIFGFEFRENFNYPYISKSIHEFWRRWHISLSTWFKEYVYIPLGGNRKGAFRTYINLCIVFFLTGLWHGASWNFVFWGLFHGFFMVAERLGCGKVLEKNPEGTIRMERLYECRSDSCTGFRYIVLRYIADRFSEALEDTA